jgi:hypothetical protein
VDLSSFPCFLFLDFDGVLVTERMFRKSAEGKRPDRDAYGHLFDDECVRNLGYVIEQTSAGIVIVSSWRVNDLDAHRIATRVSSQQWCGDPRWLAELWRNRSMPGVVVDATPMYHLQTPNDHLYHVPRGVEVELWQCEHKVDRVPYAIIDDESDFLIPQLERFVLTDIKEGITRAHAETLVRMLREPVLYPWEKERLLAATDADVSEK